MNFDLDKDPTIKQFRERFDGVADECSKDGELIYSHNILSRVTIEDTDGNYYQLVEVAADQLGGCGCWSGVRLIIKKEED